MQFNLIPKSRSRILAIITLGIMAIFIVRLFYLQIIMHDFYINLASQEQLKQLVIPSKRGEIYVMDGQKPTKVVLNQTVYTMFVDPKILKDPDSVIETTKLIAGGNMKPKANELVNKKESRYQIIATKLSKEQAERIKEKNYIGVGFQKENQRVYPEGQLASQVFGFVNAEGEGQYGIEGGLNDRLKGKDGSLQSVTDVSSVPLTIGDRNINIPAQDGEDLVLTVDRNIQAYAEKSLLSGLQKIGATNGSIIVMDPQNSQVKAMANFPTYLPAEFDKVKNIEVFNNATITVPYEPGSVIKTFTIATGLNEGVINPNSTYNNTDYIEVDGETITNATKGQTGNVTMQRALDYSLNTGMVTIAQRLGNGSYITSEARDKIYEYDYNRFGFGKLTGIELADEAKGNVVSPKLSEGNAVRYSNMSFGQGLDLTMIQVCTAFSSIINGGIYNSPTIIAGTIDDNGSFLAQSSKSVKQSVITSESSDTAREMIRAARAKFSSGQDKPGYLIGGKTGTSQTIIDGRYTFDQTIGTYLGFGGDTVPRYVIMVQVSGEGLALEGGKHAQPIFTDMSNWMIDYLKLQPKG